MTVLIVDPAGNLWGSERALLDSLSAFEGIDLVASSPAGSELSSELSKRGVPIRHSLRQDLHKEGKWILLWEALKLWVAIRRIKPSVVYLNQSGVLTLVKMACFGSTLQIVCHVRIYEDAHHVCKRLRYFGRNISAIAISRSILDTLRGFAREMGVNAKVEHVYDAYVRNSQASVSSPRAIDVCCIGRITPVKGQLVLAEALSLPPTLVAVKKVVIVGDGPSDYLELIREVLNRSGAPVEILGFRKSVSQIIESSKYLVCPSEREPLGRVIFEAWDCGAVPIAFAGSGGAAEIIEASGGGLVYLDQSPEGLANTLIDAMNMSEEQRAILVERGRAWMASNTHIDVYRRKIQKIITPLINTV